MKEATPETVKVVVHHIVIDNTFELGFHMGLGIGLAVVVVVLVLAMFKG